MRQNLATIDDEDFNDDSDYDDNDEIHDLMRKSGDN